MPLSCDFTFPQVAVAELEQRRDILQFLVAIRRAVTCVLKSATCHFSVERFLMGRSEDVYKYGFSRLAGVTAQNTGYSLSLITHPFCFLAFHFLKRNNDEKCFFIYTFLLLIQARVL